MDESKIHLSPAETELLLNAEIILTKNRVLQKIKSLLEEVQNEQLAFTLNCNLNNTPPFLISPKVSKGEYYLGLPYIILDYPRMASANDFFFIRSMFWWGNYFSSTLHLSGRYKSAYKEKISTAYHLLQDFYIGVNADQWMHHFENDNYKKIASIGQTEFVRHCMDFDHIKIAARLPLEKWKDAREELFANWKFLLELCGLNYQDGEKGL
jgi:hypothetical protein